MRIFNTILALTVLTMISAGCGAAGAHRPALTPTETPALLTTSTSTPAVINTSTVPTIETHITQATATLTALDCSLVEQILPHSPEARKIGAALLAGIARRSPGLQPYYPLQFNDIYAIDEMENWVFFLANFRWAAEGALFVLRDTPTGYRYDGTGWSGVAESPEQIHAYLASRLPGAPPELIACARVDLEPILSTTPASPTPAATPIPTSAVDCSRVERIPPDSPEGRAIGAALLAPLPDRPSPESWFDAIGPIYRVDQWIFYQAHFPWKKRAMFVLQQKPDGYFYFGEGWPLYVDEVGDVWPKSVEEIQAYLVARLPDVPPELTCLEPADWFLP